MKRKPAAIAAVLGTALLLCACGTPTPGAAVAPPVQAAPPAPLALPQDDALGYRFLCALPLTDNQTMTELARGVQDRCDELGIELVMRNAHRDHLSQATEVDAFVEGGGQAVLTLPVDGPALQPFLALARQQGVFVVALAEDMETSPGVAAGATAWADAAAGPDSYAAGRLLGENAAAFAENQAGAAVLLLEGARTPFALGVEEGYTAVLPDAQVTTHIIPETADLLVESLLAENPDIRVFLAGSDSAALAARKGVLRALAAQAQPQQGEEAPETPAPPPDLSGYYFGGMGATPRGLEALLDGRLSASVSGNGYAAGLMAVDAAVALLRGEVVENHVAQPMLIDKNAAAEYNKYL